jgi:Flp pilus assembly protein TadB
MPLLISLVAGIFLGFLLLNFIKRYTIKDDASFKLEEWDRALEQEPSQLAQFFLRTTRPLGAYPPLLRQASSPQYAFLQEKLLISGSFYSSVEIFMAFEACTAFLALSLIIGVALSSLSLLYTLFIVFIAVLLVYLPYAHMENKADIKTRAVTQNLPDFAEMLLLPLRTNSILASMIFTAEKVPGPVSDEILNLKAILDARALPEKEAFELSGHRLGTSSAYSFLAALAQAHIEGGPVLTIIENQASTLRAEAFQAARAALKKIPNRIEILITLAAAPMLFTVIILPTVLAFKGA